MNKLETGITDGIISVANHKLRTQGIEVYKEYLSKEWVSKESLLKLTKDELIEEVRKLHIANAKKLEGEDDN